MEQGSLSAVYFKRLERDAVKPKSRPKLLDTLRMAHANYKPLTAEQHGFGGASTILGMAAAEAAKEQAMLHQIFGVSLNVDLSQPGAIKQLTEAINNVFNFRSIYERNKALITDENFAGQKGVYSYFHTYFNQALRAALPSMQKEIINMMESNRALGAGEAARQVFEKRTHKLIYDAIEHMFNADTELSTMDDKHQNAYKELLSAINKFSTENIFTAQLAKAWGVDKAADEFANAFSKQRRKPKEKTMEKARSAAEKEVARSMHSKGGYSLEVLIDQALGATVAGLNGGNVSAGPARVYRDAGAKGATADNVFTFNMNTSAVDKTLRNIADSPADRQKTKEEFSKLGSELNKVKDGFIVYVNDKNYTLNDNFRRRGGMSAGTDWNLEQVRGILGGVVGDINQLIYNLLQAGSGAIYAGETENASKILAEGIAYYLFDDYTTIGNAGGNAIHVMGLQGILVPLSAFLYALGHAIQSVESNPSSYVRVSISAPAVNDSDEASYFMSNWDRQYNESMQGTTITIHFMENFIGFVKGYL